MKDENNKKSQNPCGCRERERERISLFNVEFVYSTTIYCHLENKKRKLNSSKNKGRTMPVKQAIGLSLFVLVEKVKHNHRRGGP